MLISPVNSQVFISTSASKLLDALQRRADALRSAPILPDDDEAAQIELIDQRHQVRDVMREASDAASTRG